MQAIQAMRAMAGKEPLAEKAGMPLQLYGRVAAVDIFLIDMLLVAVVGLAAEVILAVAEMGLLGMRAHRVA